MLVKSLLRVHGIDPRKHASADRNKEKVALHRAANPSKSNTALCACRWPDGQAASWPSWSLCSSLHHLWKRGAWKCLARRRGPFCRKPDASCTHADDKGQRNSDSDRMARRDEKPSHQGMRRSYQSQNPRSRERGCQVLLHLLCWLSVVESLHLKRQYHDNRWFLAAILCGEK